MILQKKIWLISFTSIFLFANGQEHIKTYPELCLTNNEFNNRYASYNYKGDKIVFESDRYGNWDIFVMNIDGTNTIQLTSNKADDRRPTWHPKKNVILFESSRTGKSELHVLNLKTNSIKHLPISTIVNPMFVSYSLNGKKIVFTVQEAENNLNIYQYNLKSKKLKVLVNNNFRNVYPRYSPNSKDILFFSRKDTNNKDDEIYTLNLKSKKVKRLTNWHKHNFCPSWSNNGKQIAYVTSMEDSRPEIYIMNNDGSNKKRITYNNDGDTLPNWSIDDKKLLITAYRNGSFKICEITLEK